MIFIMIEPQHFFLIFIISSKMEELISPVLQGTSLAQSHFLTSHPSCHFCFVCPIYLSPRTSNCLGKSFSTPPQPIQHLPKASPSFLFMSPLSHHFIQPLSFSHPLFYFTAEVQHNSSEHDKWDSFLKAPDLAKFRSIFTGTRSADLTHSSSSCQTNKKKQTKNPQQTQNQTNNKKKSHKSIWTSKTF